jgi:hypothetical protein
MTDFQRKPGYTAMATSMVAFARVDQLVRRGMDAARRGLGAMLVEAMTADELRLLSPHLYGSIMTPASAQQGLWDWEARWFAERLPAPPARIFMGGAGAGRDSLPLLERGYEIDGLEPAESLCATLATVLGPARLAVRASYEELSAAILDGAGGPAAAFVGRRYDAVVLGWGSLTHVLVERERARILAASARLTDGPILASFWMRDDAAEATSWGRAARMGKALGRGLGRLRLGGQGAPGEESAFGHAFSRAELEGLAASIGRDVIWGGASGVYPHATLVKRA